MLEQIEQLSTGWQDFCRSQTDQGYFDELVEFVRKDRAEATVYPPANEVFSAFQLTPLESVRVVILGQDPYHNDGQAHGLCFSVKKDVKLPPSLKNIYKELESDLGISPADHGCLTSWATQGILLLNTVLTVRAHEANSNRKKGWETFTDAVIQYVNQLDRSIVFVLWGKPAQDKLKLIDNERHKVVMNAHPSPLSARTGFFGSKPFSAINEFLTRNGGTAIDWSVSD